MVQIIDAASRFDEGLGGTVLIQFESYTENEHDDTLIRYFPCNLQIHGDGTLCQT